VQVGGQQRSEPNFCLACELVRNGRIGQVQTIKIGLPTDPGTEPEAPTAAPANLDYDMWLGPAPWAEYTEKRVHPDKDYERPGWLRISDYGSGMITGWGAHHLDTAQWAMGMEKSGPVEVKGWAEYPRDGLWDVHGDFKIEYKYENGVKLICSANTRNKQGVVFEGTEGRIYVRRWTVDAEPKSILTSKIKPEEIHLYRNKDHKADFLDCIKSRGETVAPVEVGHRSCTVCLLGAIAMKLGRRLKWDPKRERFGNDAQANQMLSRPMRSPWRL
jgi:predicted dehydrogenase